MKGYHIPAFCLVLLAGSFALSFRLAAEWEQKLMSHAADAPPYSGFFPKERDLSRELLPIGGNGGGFRRPEASRPEARQTERGTSQRIWKKDDALMSEYNFVNFNKDMLGVSFGMTTAEYKDYISNYGYTDKEMAALRAWREKAHADAWTQAYAKGGKAAAEKAIADVALDYDTKLRRLLFLRGFALRRGNTVECDMRLIVKRNTPVLKPLALSFQQIATERGYGAEETVGSVLSMVQTAIQYKIPPMMAGDLHTGGLLPPAQALLSGWGDCDTKTGVVASILANWSGMRLVGIAVPGHYLMAIRRIPAKGDMFVRYEGLEYVLIEPAGPAWLEPGTVGGNTSALLEGSDGYTVDPFF